MYNTQSDIWIAGAFAAISVDFMVYPFDTLKTRIQSPNYETAFKDPRTGVIKRNVLFRGLYQGVWSVVFSTIPSSGAFFTTYETVKCALHASSTHVSSSGDRSEYITQTSRMRASLPFTHSLPSPLINAIASCTAESVSCAILTPAEVIKQNAQMARSTGSWYHSAGNISHTSPQSTNLNSGYTTSATRQVLLKFKRRPWRLWSGYFALLGRNLPFTGLQFPLFEYIRGRMLSCWRKRRVTADTQREKLIERAGLTGLSAGLAGIISSFVTTPIDVVKTRVMLSASDDPGSSQERLASQQKSSKKPKGTLTIGKGIYLHEGVRGLFKGGAIRCGWTAVSLSLYLGLYEGGRYFLENRRRRAESMDRVEM
ncbi:hypothetical protein N7462_000507 [Penicillium macrosclerotiorum]|uniref:uncharacterized protein n=1 Tax=Penicillium macrosclerotiorum TaxID=303699 RepID=UPI002546E0C4|nr:uncharacterized protein N7462_000507 [Penicillium macrosclerotiorum]KAJ5698502.1 hypothetical protein N7462_000507 [Penicillium macrosclerotiorum]